MRSPIPLIDLFSGPGGLAEGFASIGDRDDNSRFQVALSIEMDPAAYLTLRLRAFLRNFRSDLPPEYYDYLNREQPEDPDWSVLYPEYWTKACDETRCLQLGTTEAELVLRSRIRELRKAHNGRTVLLGGPPCQSYSLAGRVRNAGKPGYDPNKDERQSLYLEYAKALRLLRPAVAVMENVRGILSARHHGRPVFPKIMDSLRHAGATDQYRLFALTPDVNGRLWRNELEPEDFLVRAEQHGVPQTRHRVFVICIRRDVAKALPEEALPSLEPCKTAVSVEDVIGDMPLLRSRLSRSDCGATWQRVIRDACALVEKHHGDMSHEEGRRFRTALRKARTFARGTPLPHTNEIGGTEISGSCTPSLREWLFDANVTTLPNNETRGHIPEDITRYLYAATFAHALGRTPKATDFPPKLAPKHRNWRTGKFVDRFRVQLPDRPATTITSHIAKDGHYFIHPDPRQCRSLTVREAARLQTFPDNYLFLGGRTQQYVQVGNAVPPYLARQIASEVCKVFEYWDAIGTRGSRRSPRARPIQ